MRAVLRSCWLSLMIELAVLLGAAYEEVTRPPADGLEGMQYSQLLQSVSGRGPSPEELHSFVI